MKQKPKVNSERPKLPAAMQDGPRVELAQGVGWNNDPAQPKLNSEK